VKAGLLPGGDGDDASFTHADERLVTLAPNTSAHFECRWVYLKPEPNSVSIFTAGLDELIYCPVAHGEGRISAKDAESLAALQSNGYIALTYVQADGEPAPYPGNPNGSALGIAGLTNKTGNVLGLMPHPENHILPWQHPRFRRGERGLDGLRLFENGIQYA
jgi:phosphoribosylformylglycinamidine (FGAM) synthase-like amidotransferase family enzyme